MQGAVAQARRTGRLHPDLLREAQANAGIGQNKEEDRKNLRFVPFTRASYQLMLIREEEEKLREQERKARSQEAHLKDGELKFGLDDEFEKRPDRNPDLEEGKVLREEYGKPPAYYLGLPLEEIDKGVTSKTFVVLYRWLHTIHISRFSATPACFVLSAWNPVRRIAVYICTNQIFDFFILFTIVTNCISLAISALKDMAVLDAYIPTAGNIMKYIFFGIYSTEMVIEMIARGIVFNKYTYLYDPWNWLDLIVVSSGVVSLSLQYGEDSEAASTGATTQALRTFRVLRAVKTISIFPGLRTIVNAMLRAIKNLFEVILMTAFCVLVFSLVSVQIYRGTLRQKCVHDPAHLTHLKKSFETYDDFYHRMMLDSDNWAVDSAGKYILCGNATGARSCKENYTCQGDIGENPDYGFTNFDSILSSALITFQIMTLDFWENVYQKVLLTNGSLTIVFFLLLVFFGSFYLLNLMLAVVTITYQEEAERTNKEIEDEKAAQRKRKQAVAAFYDISSLLTKQHVWARLIQENKLKEKEKESPLQKIVRLRQTIDNWQKIGISQRKCINPASIENFQIYATRDRSATEITESVAYAFKKWQQFSEHKQRKILQERKLAKLTKLQHISKHLVQNLPIPADVGIFLQSSTLKQMPTSSRHSAEIGSRKLSKNEVLPNKTDDVDAAAYNKRIPPWKLGQKESLPDINVADEPQITRVAPWKLSQNVLNPSKKESSSTDSRNVIGEVSNDTNINRTENEFENVSFEYHDQKVSACDSLDFKVIEDGNTYAQFSYESKHMQEKLNAEQLNCIQKPDDPDFLLQSNSKNKDEILFDVNYPIDNDIVGNKSENASDNSEPPLVVPASVKNSFTSTFKRRTGLRVARLPPPTVEIDTFEALKAADFDVLNQVVSDSRKSLPTDRHEEEMAGYNARPCASWRKSCLKMKNNIYEMVTNTLFDMFIYFCILLNTCLMSMEHHGMSSELESAIYIGSLVFTCLFALEALLKILGLGVRGYFASCWNRFDFIIAVFSIASVVLERYERKATQFMRTYRMLRVLKLAQIWPAMGTLFTIIGTALPALGQLTFILLIILYIFAVIGFHLFQDKYVQSNFANGIPRWNFTDFFHSFMMMFRVLCGEWTEPLWDCLRIPEVHDGVCMAVYLPTLIFGNFVVLNLFLALLLNAFGNDSHSRQESVEYKKLRETKDRFRRIFYRLIKCCYRKKVHVVRHKPVCPELCLQTGSDDLDMPMEASNLSTQSQDISVERTTSAVLLTFADKDSKASLMSPPLTKKQAESQDLSVPSCLPDFCFRKMGSIPQKFSQSKTGEQWMAFRRKVLKSIDNDIFEYFILFVIFASSLVLAFEDFDYQYILSDDSSEKIIVRNLSIAFTVLFIIEMLLRWISFGLAQYFTNVWTIIDFIVVVVSVINVFFERSSSQLPTLQALRALRALRPLRVVSRIEGMKIVVNSLIRAIPAIVNVFIVSLVFWLLFSVMGVQYFAGKFYKCVSISTLTIVNVSNRQECEQNTTHYYWYNSIINFDSVPSGFLALLQVATFEGWVEIMRDAVDSTEVDEQPRFEASVYTYVYFVAFIICGSFFTLNLVIGVIIDNFNVLKKKYEGSFMDAFLTLNQRNFYNTLKKITARKPEKIIAPPHRDFQKVFYRLSVSEQFDLILMGAVLLNTVLIVLEFYAYKVSCFWKEVLLCGEVAFCTFFILEALLKIIGLRQHYFTLAWNVYDFIVAILSIIDITVHIVYNFASLHDPDFQNNTVKSSKLFPPTYLRILRLIRISKVLRIFKVAKGLRKVMFSLMISLAAIFNIMALLLLVIFIYASFGMFLFSNVKLTGALTESMNFRSLKNSVFVLLSLSTAAGWNEFLGPLLISPPFCNNTHQQLPDNSWIPSLNGNCGNYWIAIPYMVSYIIFTYLFIINMYIAVILENYQQAHQQEEVGVTDDDFEMFYSVWQRYDPNATQFIPYIMLSDFVADLDHPLGIEKPNEIALVSINLPILQGDRVHCLDILLALVKNVLSEVNESDEMFSLKQQMNEKFAEKFPIRAKMTVISTTIQRKKEDVAARTLQRAWQVFKTQQAIHSIMKLAVKDIKDHNKTVPRTVPTIEELRFNMNLACIKYFQDLMDVPSIGFTGVKQSSMFLLWDKASQSTKDGREIRKSSVSQKSQHML